MKRGLHYTRFFLVLLFCLSLSGVGQLGGAPRVKGLILEQHDPGPPDVQLHDDLFLKPNDIVVHARTERERRLATNLLAFMKQGDGGGTEIEGLVLFQTGFLDSACEVDCGGIIGTNTVLLIWTETEKVVRNVDIFQSLIC